MDGGKKVWVPHPIEGFKLGRIVDIGSDLITIEPFDAPGSVSYYIPYEPRSEKTGLRGFRPGPTQTGLYSDRRWLEA